jgi:hypothetical protein
MEQMPPFTHVVAAQDFARGVGNHVPGQEAASPGNTVRAAISPEAYWAMQNAMARDVRIENARMGGIVDNRDDSLPQRVSPRVDPSPALGRSTKAISYAEYEARREQS